MKSKRQRCYGLVNAGWFSKKRLSYQGLKMELKVKNLASSDSRGYDLQKEVMVKVTNQRTHEVRLLLRRWAWASSRAFWGPGQLHQQQPVETQRRGRILGDGFLGEESPLWGLPSWAPPPHSTQSRDLPSPPASSTVFMFNTTGRL